MKLNKAVFAGLIVMLAIGAFGLPASYADPDDAYKKEPGYVDFDKMGIFDDLESSIEIFIKGPLLKLALEAVKHEEPDVADLIRGLKLVRVQVFTLEGDDQSERLKEKTEAVAKELEKKGWDMAVRVRDRDEQVYIYMLPGKKDNIDGLVVMVVEEGNEAVFVNIVGTINPENIGRLGRSFDIDQLEDWEDEIKKEKKDRKRSRRGG